jgi:hypothetical protein
MTTSDAPAPGAVRLDIQRITLDGYTSGQRVHFAGALQARLTAAGAPEEAARQAAEAILDAVDGDAGIPGG